MLRRGALERESDCHQEHAVSEGLGRALRRRRGLRSHGAHRVRSDSRTGRVGPLERIPSLEPLTRGPAPTTLGAWAAAAACALLHLCVSCSNTHECQRCHLLLADSLYVESNALETLSHYGRLGPHRCCVAHFGRMADCSRTGRPHTWGLAAIFRQDGRSSRPLLALDSEAVCPRSSCAARSSPTRCLVSSCYMFHVLHKCVGACLIFRPRVSGLRPLAWQSNGDASGH